MDEFPPNSYSTKEPTTKYQKPGQTDAPAKDDEKKIEPVVTGQVLRRKKPLSKRFKEVFFAGDGAQSVLHYVLMDVLIPAAKDVVADAVTQTVERTLFPDRAPGTRRSYRGGSSGGYTSYNRFSSPSPTARRDEPRREISRTARAKHQFDEIILATRVEANEAIDKLIELISKYGSASVADLYEIVDISANFTDQKWGWTDLRGADVTMVRTDQGRGYLLDLPQPEQLD